ncbi:PAS domain S-box protein [Actomonas aquatica]|uniref:histidine kinase n=1 Tax=Actomonas aquatica TaxID=2866162 RepID=A0ABZ1C4X8_9BACT|nr:PAS domain S-box protein [Opitutus sp. WL0086]WRQ86447.1 PAS domain S-box protein [Opitutus sp. WL0086]
MRSLSPRSPSFISFLTSSRTVWLAVPTLIIACAFLLYSEIQLREEVITHQQHLNRIRSAHVHLGQGMLHVTLAASDATGFDRAAGLTHFSQCLELLDSLQPELLADGESLHPDDYRAFTADLELFRSLVEDLPRDRHDLSNTLRRELEESFRRLSDFLVEAENLHHHQLLESGRGWERGILATASIIVAMLCSVLGGAFLLLRRFKADANELRQSELLLASIGDNLPQAYVYQWHRAHDAPPRFTYLSRGVENVHGVPRAEALADANLVLSQLEGNVRQRLLEAEDTHAQSLSPLEIELSFRRADGAHRQLILRARPQRLADGVYQWDGICADITEQRQHELAHLQIDADLKAVSELAHIGTWSFDPATGDGYWSDEVARIHDLAPDEYTSRRIGLSVYPEPWLSRIQAAIRDAIEHARPYELDLFMVTPAGNKKWVRALGFPVLEDGDVVRLRGTIQDITERKLAHQRIATSEAQFRLLFEEAADGIILLTKDHRMNKANQHLLDLLGQDGENLINTPLDAIILPADRESVRRRLLAIDTGATDLLEVQLQHADGHAVDSEIGIRRLTNDRLVCIVRDLTRRRQAERRSALHVAVTEALAHAHHVGESAERVIELFCEYLDWDYGVFWRVNGPGTHLHYTAHWYPGSSDYCDLADHHRQAPLTRGQGFAGCIWDEGRSRWDDCTVDLADDDIPPELVSQLKLRARLAVPVNLRGKTLGVFEFYSQQPPAARTDLLNFLAGLGTQFGFFIERTQLSESVLQAQKMEAMGTLSGGIAHDFNNLLSAIVGHTELAAYCLDDRAEAEENLTQVKKATKRASQLVRQLLDFSRRADEETPAQRIPVDLHQIITETSAFLRASIPHNIRLDIQLPPELPATLADPTQLQQVLLNLGTNAIHAMGAEPGTLTYSADTVDLTPPPDAQSVLSAGTYLHIQVSDTGHGMDETTRARIFEPFFTTKKRQEGTGLGLAVTHSIIRSHGGSIAVESEPGLGTTFHLHLPASSSPPGTASGGGHADLAISDTDPATDALESHAGRGETILLVEDESSVARPVQHLLEMAHYHVVVCLNPSAALDIFQDAPDRFDLMLTDYAMPELDGLELTRRVKAIRADLPIVLTSGLIGTLPPQVIIDAGVSLLLPKPVTSQRLLKTIRQTLDA